MDLLAKLMERCKCGVHLAINEHRNHYWTVQQQLDWFDRLGCPPEISEEVRTGILKGNTIINLIFYPDTPIGSYQIVHYDLDKALEFALEHL
jgi:hypothetical protein